MGLGVEGGAGQEDAVFGDGLRQEDIGGGGAGGDDLGEGGGGEEEGGEEWRRWGAPYSPASGQPPTPNHEGEGRRLSGGGGGVGRGLGWGWYVSRYRVEERSDDLRSSGGLRRIQSASARDHRSI